MEKKEFLQQWMLEVKRSGRQQLHLATELENAQLAYKRIEEICSLEESHVVIKRPGFKYDCHSIGDEVLNNILAGKASDILRPSPHKSRIINAAKALLGKNEITIGDLESLTFNQLYGCRNVGSMTMSYLDQSFVELGIKWHY